MYYFSDRYEYGVGLSPRHIGRMSEGRTMEVFLIYALVGAFAGLIAGLFGVGGGLVIVPVLVFVFSTLQLAPSHLVHLAIGTSLATIVFTSLSSVYAHHRHGAVQWPLFLRLLPGMATGALLGAKLAHWLPTGSLRAIFGIFELLVAAHLAFGGKPSLHRNLPGLAGLSGVAILIGAISALVGIGGGTMTVPFLVWCQVEMRQAIATSAACGLPIALAGAAGFILSAWQMPDLPPWSTGYIYWPAALAIVSVSIFFAPLGARLAHRLPATQLKRLFALFLTGLGIYMLFS
jgi:uncharacterized protein